MTEDKVLDDILKKFEGINIDTLSDEELKQRMEDAIIVMRSLSTDVDLSNKVITSDRVNTLGYDRVQKILTIIKTTFLPLMARVELGKAEALLKYGTQYAAGMAEKKNGGVHDGVQKNGSGRRTVSLGAKV